MVFRSAMLDTITTKKTLIRLVRIGGFFILGQFFLFSPLLDLNM